MQGAMTVANPPTGFSKYDQLVVLQHCSFSPVPAQSKEGVRRCKLPDDA